MLIAYPIGLTGIVNRKALNRNSTQRLNGHTLYNEIFIYLIHHNPCGHLIDILLNYVIIHQVVSTKVKNHCKEFWAELSKHNPHWKEFDEKMYGMKL
ncbi:M48 family peptidase [Flavobacterium petrolei]|uniref:M48 family peptidase n=1 Tax=Flavobacterium petrolei TaxID=2259594 RepID=A0A482TU02_9FLAO|nr:YgjP-like metallopeptidase domain-containing protein [Flavobacterium petrolei]RYJ50996.1 M48 family peptidase [Flavobacterium petrolei]